MLPPASDGSILIHRLSLNNSLRINNLPLTPGEVFGVPRRSLYNAMCPSFEYETFLHVLHGKQYDKQVQGGSVLIIEPGTLCVSQRPKKRCVKF